LNDDVKLVLTQLVHEEGSAFYGDLRRAEARLWAVAGGYRPAEVVVLVAALRAGVAEELAATNPGLVAISVRWLSTRMARSYGIEPEASRWAVESWAGALGVGTAAQSDAPAAPSSPVAPLPSQPPPSPRHPPPSEPPGWGRPPPDRRRRVAAWVPWVATGVVVVVSAAVLVAVLVRTASSPAHEGRTTGTTAATSESTTATSATAAATGQQATLTVPPGLNLGTGDVQVTLLWDNGNDLDLHVVDPSGAEIYFSNPRSSTGGSLDHDDTAGCSTSGTHVENVFWPTGGAPPGRYRVVVKNYTSCGSPTQYRLRVTVGGHVIRDSTATLAATDGTESPPFEFTR
jgi:hypothetical protein